VPLELENSGVTYLRVGPNFRIPFGHDHNVQEEVFVVISGSARVKLDDEIIELKQFDALRVPHDTVRNFEGGPDGVELIAIGEPNTGPGDANMTQGWWTD
jgi:mannose-6-phosphate isomerase-like protein (cupin superfamily)